MAMPPDRQTFDRLVSGSLRETFLECVRNRTTSEAALAALKRVDAVPVEQIFQFFDSPRQGERFAAAVVLGRLDDPEIPRRLIRMVAAGTRQRSTWPRRSCPPRCACRWANLYLWVG